MALPFLQQKNPLKENKRAIEAAEGRNPKVNKRGGKHKGVSPYKIPLVQLVRVQGHMPCVGKQAAGKADYS